MEDELEILTEKQKKIYLLRSKGVPLKRIAEEMGITVSAVSRYFHIIDKIYGEFRLSL
jgi:predicted transcriptional regulator